MRSRVFVLILAAAVFGAAPAHAQWQPDGVEVCAASSAQYHPVIEPDGSGGCVIAWRDVTRNGYYAQRLNAAGVPQWTADGVRITDLPAPVDLQATYDGRGGMIVTWDNGSDIWLQKVTVDGALAWGSAGVDVCSGEPNNRGVARICSDNLFSVFVGDPPPGAIVEWSDSRAGPTTGYAFAQSVNGNGVARWTANGVMVSTDSSVTSQGEANLVSDGTAANMRTPKGAIICWSAQKGSENVYAQRLNSAGVRQWTNAGIPVCAATGNQFFQGAIAFMGSGNATMIWLDDRNGDTYELYGNREGTSGEWAVDGRPVCPVGKDKFGVVDVSDGLGGIFAAWSDERSGNDGDIYVQRMDSGGNPLWGTSGTPIAVGSNPQVEPVLLPDSHSGTFVVYVDLSTDEDLFAQEVDSSGTALWDPPVPVCLAQGDQEDESVISDGSGGFIVAWRDARGGAERIYAQHVSASGGVVAANVPVPRGVRLAQPYPNPSRGAMTEKFELPVAERVSAAVFDVQGRLVSSLAQDELLGAGNHELRWDGLDRERAKVAAGVYLFEMRAGDEKLVRRALVIR